MVYKLDDRMEINRLGVFVGEPYDRMKKLFLSLLISALRGLEDNDGEFIIPTIGKVKIDLNEELTSGGKKLKIDLSFLEVSKYLEEDIINFKNGVKTRAEHFFEKQCSLVNEKILKS